MIKTFNGVCLTLKELKEFVDRCYNEYLDTTPVRMFDSELHDEETNIRSALADDESICFYQNI